MFLYFAQIRGGVAVSPPVPRLLPLFVLFRSLLTPFQDLNATMQAVTRGVQQLLMQAKLPADQLKKEALVGIVRELTISVDLLPVQTQNGPFSLPSSPSPHVLLLFLTILLFILLIFFMFFSFLHLQGLLE